VDLDAAIAVHRHRFANAADFTFFVVGSFQPDSIAPLLARYLGSLPSTGKRTATYAAIGPRYPNDVRNVQVHKGVEPKASVRITYFTNAGLEELDLHRARACASILTDHLRQSLRELLGGTYSASASFSNLQPLPGYETMTIAFGCDPQRVDTLIAATLAEVQKLRDAGPSLADVQKDQEIERRELEVGLKENGFWSGSLLTLHLLGWDPLRILKRRERIDLLTPDNLRATFAKYFPPDRYTVITLLPETTMGAK
jgi:zinc protease